MADVGLYALTKIVVGGLSAFMTGPLGTMDIPAVDIQNDVIGRPAGYSAEVIDHHSETLGHVGHGKGTSPAIADLPEHFIQALLSVEDARFGAHPGVDPMAVVSAGIDTLRGNRRGGSTITQQLVKNSVTGSDLTYDRKIKEAIVSVRISEAHDPESILQAYLANVWFGRGQEGVSGASWAWFGKPWSEIELHESAFLAGILKGPAYYDPIANPDRALKRRNVVLDMMHARNMITDGQRDEAQASPLSVITQVAAADILNRIPKWVSSAVENDFSTYGILERTDASASGDMVVRTTIDMEWQGIAENALRKTIERIGGAGAAGSVDLLGLSYGEELTSQKAGRVRNSASQYLSTNASSGRAIIVDRVGGSYRGLLDRGYGRMEWVTFGMTSSGLGYSARPGDVLPYTRVDGTPVLHAIPQVQGAVVIMAPESGAILASVGGYDADVSPFDRTRAARQPGSAIKPFLWLKALEEGMIYNTMVEDIEMVYASETGERWRPRNYDGSQSGLIPLFVALEESSNLVAANLSARLGIPALAEITEDLGVYPKDGMRRHMSSALGASEATLQNMAAGYAAIANGGMVVSPHHIESITKNGRLVWTPRDLPTGMHPVTYQSTADITSMLYGVTKRGTAAGAFRGSMIDVAGKTGTTQDYRDAWFMSFVPGVVVAVWIGRDDFKSIPGNRSGSSAAAPVAREIYDEAARRGLLSGSGARLDQTIIPNWPPALLSAGNRQVLQRADPSEPFKRPVASTPETSYLNAPSRVLSRGPAWPDDISGPHGQSAAGQGHPGPSSYLDDGNQGADLMLRTPW